MTKFGNSKKNRFLEKRIKASIESHQDTLIERCKFNFSYMDFSQKSGQTFNELEKKQLADLLNKLKDFSKETLGYWENMKMGGGKKGKNYNVLEIYGDFPKKSEFHHPVFVPHEARWGRFRLNNLERLIGFTLPPKYHNTRPFKKDYCFDCNTFYVVFYDPKHKFYAT
ncbi:hypothetical protein [uncultured Desulfobacter sp.]|uniref:hypothetical protein n=1 Tax=uncultured Desulfobacter sp. TaxID=240139 RepID=UPI002AA8979E|nr:hypothetical protein [uncultured Desulfobacter sp.]